MKALQSVSFRLPPERLSGVLNHLRRHVNLDGGDEHLDEVTYFDTFDWRLHRAARRFELRRGAAFGRRPQTLCRLTGDDAPLDLPGSELGKHGPGFAADMPEGPFRDAVEALIKMRRLLPALTLRTTTTEWRVLGPENKTVVRLFLESPTAHPHPWPGPNTQTEATAGAVLDPRLRVEPVRGYDDADRKLRQLLHKTLDLPVADRSLFEDGATRCGLPLGLYSSKPEIHIGADETAADATRAVLLFLLEAMEANEDGTRRDVDSEFLHDFRVAVRRTRAALSQIKRVFPDDRTLYFKQEFRWLGGLTGPTRDLDVYLLKMPDYRRDLPAAAQHDLRPLEAYLATKQRREQRRLAKGLTSPRYRKLIADWRAFLESDEAPPLPDNAAVPIRDLASERIRKIYRRVLKQGLAIDDASPAERLHDVRLECKKLRYLMEFFRSLYARSEVDGAIKALKRLQDNLGDFNDYEVQQASLGELAEELAARPGCSAGTLLAMGRLQSRLAEGRRRERDAFKARFDEFASGANQALYERLFRLGS